MLTRKVGLSAIARYCVILLMVGLIGSAALPSLALADGSGAVPPPPDYPPPPGGTSTDPGDGLDGSESVAPGDLYTAELLWLWVVTVL